VRTYIFTNLYLNKLTVYILIKVITLDPGRYFLKHWMRVLPIENSARGGFIPINLPNPGGTRIPRYIRIITFRVTTARDAPAPGGCDPSQFRTFFLTVHLSIHI
jgi:hypothetical protein